MRINDQQCAHYRMYQRHSYADVEVGDQHNFLGVWNSPLDAEARVTVCSLPFHEQDAMGHPFVSVVIPVYRSAGTLEALVQRLVSVLDRLGLDYEIVLVNDGSPDNSWEVMSHIQMVHPDRVLAIQLMRNFGQHNALMCGFRHARGALVVTMDDDLQNPPEEIPKLIDAITARQLDLVYGRYAGKRHESWRNVGSLALNLFYRLVFKSNRRTSSFRIMRRQLVESILTYNLNFTFIDGLLAWNTQRIGEVVVEHHHRGSGQSGYSIAKLLVLALNLITNFSLLPLQLVSGLGFLVACGGFVCAFYYLMRYLMVGIVVPGYASIIIAVLVLGGVQLLSLGIIGEYLGRLHLNVNRKPQYVERQIMSNVVMSAFAEVDAGNFTAGSSEDSHGGSTERLSTANTPVSKTA